MYKEEKRLAVLEVCDQEHLMRQEGEKLGSGGGSGDQVEDGDKKGKLDQEQDEYSDSMSTAVDEVIYHRLLDSLDVIRAERDRIREERDRHLEALVDAGGAFRRCRRILAWEDEECRWRMGISFPTVTRMLAEVLHL